MNSKEQSASEARNPESHVMEIVSSDEEWEAKRDNFCRICQSCTNDAVVNLGCRCKGELGNAHRSCMVRWFESQGTNKCEICGQVAIGLPMELLSIPEKIIPITVAFWGAQEGGDTSSGYPVPPRVAQRHRIWLVLLIVSAIFLLDLLLSIILRGYSVLFRLLVAITVMGLLVDATELEAIVNEIYRSWCIQRDFMRTWVEAPESPTAEEPNTPQIESQVELNAAY